MENSTLYTSVDRHSRRWLEESFVTPANVLYCSNLNTNCSQSVSSTASPVMVSSGRRGFSGLLARPWTCESWSFRSWMAMGGSALSIFWPHPGC